MLVAKDNATVFNANADYMQETYGIDLNVEFCSDGDNLEARLQTSWDNDEWFEENGDRWADIIRIPGHVLAVVADGKLGQSSTYYHAVIELEEI